MTDNEILEDFLTNKIFTYKGTPTIYRFNLKELKQLRELVNMAIVQRLEEYSPAVFHPIFKEDE